MYAQTPSVPAQVEIQIQQGLSDPIVKSVANVRVTDAQKLQVGDQKSFVVVLPNPSNSNKTVELSAVGLPTGIKLIESYPLPLAPKESGKALVVVELTKSVEKDFGFEILATYRDDFAHELGNLIPALCIPNTGT